MRVIDTAAALARALDQPLDPDLKRLLTTRRDQLGGIDNTARFVIAHPGDSLASVEAALGFPIATNLVDGSVYPDPDFTPSWEHVRWHSGGWAEVVFILFDDGAAEVLLAQAGQGADPVLSGLLNDHAAPALERIGPATA